MAAKTKKPAGAGTPTGLPKSVIPGGIDIPEVTHDRLQVQAARLAHRFGLSGPIARVVAEHAFGVGRRPVTVIPLTPRKLPRVLVDTGVRFIEGPSGHDLGLRLCFVTFVDADGSSLVDVVTYDRPTALEAAAGWADETGARILDKTEALA